MWKKLCLAEISPIKAFERTLLRDRDSYLTNTNRTLGFTKIIIKKKKVIDRGN